MVCERVVCEECEGVCEGMRVCEECEGVRSGVCEGDLLLRLPSSCRSSRVLLESALFVLG